ncbi:hypothetical protein WR25_25073 [Diploscapter pachys]|uniref:DEP domain-containing protein n=1 Tax=Diploscapter pachys TaxID=2018661 RepID=A0A2A2KRR3_9BILA|nr:hypothetical protein WR25_25073 [Diploscapter pachys]
MGETVGDQNVHPDIVTTKVFHYIDDDPTPFLSTIQTPNGVVTLGDFKRVFDRKGFKYFCKEVDPDINSEVKIELTDDLAKLRKSATGRYELYLLSILGQGTLPRAGTLPRKYKDGVNGNDRPRRRRSLVDLEGIGQFPASHPPSSLSTVISRRAGEHLAVLDTSNSEDPYHYDDSTRFSGCSPVYEACHNNGRGVYDRYEDERIRKRRPRKERYRRAYVPSTISSATESSMVSFRLPRILEVNVSVKPTDFLGISVVTYDGNIFVSDINPAGAVAKDGRIEVGDQIIKVNKISFETLSDEQAIDALKEAARLKRPVTLFIVKTARSTDYDPLSTLASETLPLDVDLWVQTAVQRQQEMMNKDGLQEDMSQTFAEGTLAYDAETDEEEKLLYDQRRNGIPKTVLERNERKRENEMNERLQFVNNAEVQLTSSIDPMYVIRAMVQKSSTLQVKNRKWLKILVPNSFIGSDLVEWLMENLVDLKDKKAARQYASRLLSKGLIKHVVSKLTFTEKCYYVFGDSVVHLLNDTNNSNGTGGTFHNEITTEVTYVGSPAPAGLQSAMPVRNRLLHQLETTMLSPVSYDTTWQRRRKDCESPMTNDYASMIGVDSSTSYNRGINAGALPSSTLQHTSTMPSTSRIPPSTATASTMTSSNRHHQPPNTPLSTDAFAPPYPSPCETEFEDDDKRRILNKS